MKTFEKIQEILVEQLGVSMGEVTPSASLAEDLGADSLDAVELTMAIEEAFDITVPDEDAERIRTVKEIVEYVDKRVESEKEERKAQQKKEREERVAQGKKCQSRCPSCQAQCTGTRAHAVLHQDKKEHVWGTVEQLDEEIGRHVRKAVEEEKEPTQL